MPDRSSEIVGSGRERYLRIGAKNTEVELIWIEENQRLRAALQELVTLKFDRPPDYEERKPKAWEAARQALLIDGPAHDTDLCRQDPCECPCPACDPEHSDGRDDAQADV